MRIMTLNEMLTQLRMEARISTNVAHGAHLNDNHVALLRRVQEELYSAHDWPLLNMVESVSVPAGARYATYPTNMSFEGVKRALSTDASGKWFELSYGIGVEHLNLYDSDADVRNPVIFNWKHYLSPNAEELNQNMFEVWPIPNEPRPVRFEGKRTLFPLSNPETDRSTVDGPLIVLHAAAEILAAQKAEDAPLKLQKAQQRFDLLKRRQTAPDNRRLNLAGSGPRRALRPGLDYIP